MQHKQTILVLLGLFILWIVGAAQAETFNFLAAEDAWVNQSNPDTNYGNGTYLNVKDRSGLAETYIKFSNQDLASLINLPITSATLHLFQYQDNYSPGDAINIHNASGEWSEESITWTNKPGYELSIATFLPLNSENNIWREWGGLEQTVSSWVNGANYGIVLESGSDGVNEELFSRFYSSEYSNENYRPYLQVHTAPEPVSTALFLLGGGILGLRLRRKTKA